MKKKPFHRRDFLAAIGALSGSMFVPPALIGCDSSSEGSVTDMNDNALELILNRIRLIDTVTKLFVYIDGLEWTKLLDECLAAEVLFDMRSLSGTEPANVAATDIVAGWDTGLKSLEAVHHQIGNFLVTVRDTDADVFCYGIATHYLPNASGENVRIFVGSYDFHLNRRGDQWRIDLLRFNLKYIDGNPNLEQT
jgi:hypothetical protein